MSVKKFKNNNLLDSSQVFDNEINSTLNNIFKYIYPVGSIYISVNNTNPSTLFGGTWSSFGTGMCLVGVDISQTEFNTVLKTGGSKLLQSHNHNWNAVDGNKVTWNNQFSQLPAQLGLPGTTYVGGYPAMGGQNSDYSSAGYLQLAASGQGNSGNLQPYITVYMWRRTA